MVATKQVSAILRGAEILQVLINGAMRLEDIYPMTSLSKSTVHRILKSLVEAGFASQNPLNRRYLLGPLFIKAMSCPETVHSVLTLSAIEELTFLNQNSNETALLIIPSGVKRLVLKEICSTNQISLSLGEGSTQPIYNGSSGRVLLSQYNDQELKQILNAIVFEPDEAGTVMDNNILMYRIDKIRCEGFAVSTGEMHPDSVGIAVPVKGYICPVALCVWGPKYRFDPLSQIKAISQSAVRICDNLKSAMAKVT
jgi:IclR family transcriptional regulator, acetate operon repressor